jgi:hypothetical protein
MAGDIVFSEILCFIHCKFGTVPNLSLQCAISGFYEVDVIFEAKKILNGIAEKCLKDAPTHGKRQGDGRKKRECDDLINMYELLDKSKCDLPKFVATDLNNIPNLKASEADVCVLMTKVSELTEGFEQMRKQVANLVAAHPNVGEICKVSVSSADQRSVGVAVNSDWKGGEAGVECVTQNKGMNQEKYSNVNRYHNNSKKIADVIKDMDNEEWTTVQQKKRIKIPPKFGTKENVTDGKKNLKAAKSKRTWHIYVGNLDKETTANDMRDFFKDNDVEVFTCDPLGDGHWDERPASFHVEVDYTRKDLIMDESFWDVGVKVRNWSFPKKHK